MVVSDKKGKAMIRYEPEQWVRAEQLYFQHYNTGQITKLTGIPIKTLEAKIYGDKRTKPENTWKARRMAREKELVEAVTEDNLYHLQKLFSISLPLLTDAVATRAKEHYGDPAKGVKAKPMSMKEAKMLTEIVTDLDHLFRLETKQPTELKANQVTVSIEDLRAALKKDLFLDLTADGRLAVPSEGSKDVTPRTAGDVPTLPEDGFGDQEGGAGPGTVDPTSP